MTTFHEGRRNVIPQYYKVLNNVRLSEFQRRIPKVYLDWGPFFTKHVLQSIYAIDCTTILIRLVYE